MEELVFQSGYLGLFLVSFFAATLLPLGSELFVAAMISHGYNPFIVFTAASAGNTLGAAANYAVGKYGADFILSRCISIDASRLSVFKEKVRKFGAPVLFFSWVPVIGDPLTLAAGALNLNFYIFTFWVLTGKALRYAVIILTAEHSQALAFLN